MPIFIPFLSRRVYDFSSMVGTATEVVVVRALDVVDWRAGQLVVRVHAVTITAGTINVAVLMTSPSVDAPQTDFVRVSPDVASAAIAGSVPGDLVVEALRAPIGGHLRLVVQAVASGGGGTLRATLSAALYMRERP